MKFNKSILTILFYLVFVVITKAQESKISWKKSENVEQTNLHLFHSTHAINLSTTETLQKGDIEFEIAHRFLPTINDGAKALYGFDGPANIKLSLGYAISDNFVATVARTNVDDNILIKGKYQFFQLDNSFLPFQLAGEGGLAWNSDPIGREPSNNMNFQYYGQLIFNTLIEKKLGIGLVPSYIYNSHIYCPEKEYSFTFGTNIQYYISDLVNVLAEWNPTVSGFRHTYNSLNFGAELETGGHFFKIIFSNNSNLSPTQYLTGADLPITIKNWRIGFNITRLL
ncbi:MAG: hypothetical protein H6610_11555 [Ignavibacteriales bacterium]|nr:hypothetical protein [Ignavibacteriales bacterium]